MFQWSKFLVAYIGARAFIFANKHDKAEQTSPLLPSLSIERYINLPSSSLPS